MDWKSINVVGNHTLDSDLDTHQELFTPGLGTLKGHKAKSSWRQEHSLASTKLALYLMP